MLNTFVLIMTIISGDHETGEVTNIALATNLSEADCMEILELAQPAYLGNNNVGMHCEVDYAPEEGN